MKDNKYCKVRDHCHYTEECRGAAFSICNLIYSVSKKISIVFNNGSNYDYHLRENIKTYITFTVLIEKEVTRLDKNGEKMTKLFTIFIRKNENWKSRTLCG